ncbi:MAG TPA: LON peptidase substrate-binding domain-containing protein, partial [Candidatus Eisenbacteria bacterium]|nr:LON peptidase substrate-binding domain-containing protein [Candidatus Eisenbacteria bacterium]
MKDEATEAGKQKARLNIPAGTLAIIPLRNRVLFPSMMMPLSVNRPARRQIVEEAVRQQIPIGFVTLKDSKVENPAPSDLFKVGTAADVLRVFSLPDG